jgi:antitoxin ParD1/3/4
LRLDTAQVELGRPAGPSGSPIGESERAIEPAVADAVRFARDVVLQTVSVPAGTGFKTVDSSGRLLSVSRNTMSFALPESLREYIDARVRSGDYGNTSEYLRDLIRRDQQDQAARRLRELITDGLDSGPATPLTQQQIAELRKRALSSES